MEESFSKLQIARVQLERALDLFFSEKDFISVITLAGAAEEILGKMLEEGGGRNAIDGLVDGALGKIDSRRDPERKTIVRIANRIRNGLKHLGGTDSLLFDPEGAATEMLDRAVENFFVLTGEETSQMARFKERYLRPRA